MSSLEQRRRRLDDPIQYSQKVTKVILERQRHLNGATSKKAERAEARKAKEKAEEQQSAQEWIKMQSESNLDPRERFELAWNRGTNKDIGFLFENVGDMEKFGYIVEEFTFNAERKTEVEESFAATDAKIA